MDSLFDTSPDGSVIFKIILLGSSAVGKTAFCNNIRDVEFDYLPPTIGVDFHGINMDIEGKNYCIQIWDTAGHERFKTITNTYYRGSHIALLCFDVSSRKSFEDISDWIEELGKFANDETALFLVGLKTDLENVIMEDEITRLMIENHILTYYQFSSKKDRINKMNSTEILKDVLYKYMLYIDEIELKRKNDRRKQREREQYDDFFNYKYDEAVVNPYTSEIKYKKKSCC